MEAPDLFWIQDSSGVYTCHVNDGSTFQQSLIGTLNLRGDGWHVILKDNTDITPREGCPTYARAKRAMENYYRRPSKTQTVDRLTPRDAQPGKV